MANDADRSYDTYYSQMARRSPYMQPRQPQMQQQLQPRPQMMQRQQPQQPQVRPTPLTLPGMNNMPDPRPMNPSRPQPLPLPPTPPRAPTTQNPSSPPTQTPAPVPFNPGASPFPPSWWQVLPGETRPRANAPEPGPLAAQNQAQWGAYNRQLWGGGWPGSFGQPSFSPFGFGGFGGYGGFNPGYGGGYSPSPSNSGIVPQARGGSPVPMSFFAKGGKVRAPRQMNIMGQDHFLAYITPDEAADLMRMGGGMMDGEPVMGPDNIPAYFRDEVDSGAAMHRDAAASSGGGMSGGYSGGTSGVSSAGHGRLSEAAYSRAQADRVAPNLTGSDASRATDIARTFLGNERKTSAQIDAEDLGDGILGMLGKAATGLLGGYEAGPLENPEGDFASGNAEWRVDPLEAIGNIAGTALGIPGLGFGISQLSKLAGRPISVGLNIGSGEDDTDYGDDEDYGRDNDIATRYRLNSQIAQRAEGGRMKGPGKGMDDMIPAMLSDGEYVVDAETVAMLGDGSNDAGADMLDRMRMMLRKQKRRPKKGMAPKAKHPFDYMR